MTMLQSIGIGFAISMAVYFWISIFDKLEQIREELNQMNERAKNDRL
jgi:hypothetical protein